MKTISISGKKDTGGLRIEAECIPCVLSVRAKELEMLGIRGERATIMLAEIARMLADSVFSGVSLAVASTKSYRMLKETAAINDPYKEIKAKASREAKDAVAMLRSLLSGLDGYDRFMMMAKAALLGNSMDFGVADYFPPNADDLVDEIFGVELAIDDTHEVYGMLTERPNRILYLLDNAGEAVFDGLFAGVLGEIGSRVICVAKSRGGFQNDVTIGDAIESGLEDVCELLESGTDASSIFLDEISDELREELRRADVVIAKGMAHYEYLQDVELPVPIVYMLRAKCKVMASSLGVGVGDYVFVLKR